jgi:hypothetical protein
MFDYLLAFKLEHLWVALALVGLCSARSWWVAVLLSAMGSVQIGAFYMLPSWGYDMAAPFVEFGVALMVYSWGGREAWATVVIWLFVASFTVQAIAAFFAAFGVPMDRFSYVTLNAIYTAQLASVAYPGGRCLGHALRSLSTGRSRDLDADKFSTWGA